MFSMSFYMSLMITQFTDVVRKDFWTMFIHHIATILLIAVGWISHLHRFMALLLIIHDCSDVLLEVTTKKTFNHINIFLMIYVSNFLGSQNGKICKISEIMQFFIYFIYNNMDYITVGLFFTYNLYVYCGVARSFIVHFYKLLYD